MKRDARIGLAVVLVIGTSVSLLIGRALYKRSIALAKNQDHTQDKKLDEGALNEFDFIDQDQDRPTTIAGRSENPQRFDPDQIDRRLPEPLNPQPSPTPINPTPVVNPTPQMPPTPDSLLTHLYVIQRMDNPWKIGNKLYGDGRYARQIMAANPNVDPRRLRVGLKIKIPPVEGQTLRQNLPLWREGNSALEMQGTPPPETAGNAGDFAGSPQLRRQSLPPESINTVSAARPANPTPGLQMTETGRNGGVYKIERGDTLGRIAKRVYGTAGYRWVKKIQKANPGLDPRRLKIGKEIKIPAANG